MKAIQTSAVINRISSRTDKSLSFSAETPEFSDTEFAAFRNLQGTNVTITVTPSEDMKAEKMVIDRESGQKTPSERLYNVLFVLWNEKYKEKWPTFRMFYEAKMEQIITQVKEKI